MNRGQALISYTSNAIQPGSLPAGLTIPPIATVIDMTVARSHLVDPAHPGAYHLVNRCVRRGFLCGDRWDHRRQWVHDHIRDFARLFAVDVLAYAVMANHFHLVVTTHPERSAGWSPPEVAERWAGVYPLRAEDGLRCHRIRQKSPAAPPTPSGWRRTANASAASPGS